MIRERRARRWLVLGRRDHASSFVTLDINYKDESSFGATTFIHHKYSI